MSKALANWNEGQTWVGVHFELGVNYEYGFKQKEIALSTFVKGFS